MIYVTALNGQRSFYINDELIELVEETPDTVISLQSGKKVMVAESQEEVVAKIRAVRKLRGAN